MPGLIGNICAVHPWETKAASNFLGRCNVKNIEHLPVYRACFALYIALAVMRASIPTERQVLRCIYDMYEPSFPVEGSNSGKVMVAIDIDVVAKKLGCNKHLLCGYLYYHLDHKHRYKTGENAFVHLFAPRAGELRHAVNFPYLGAVPVGYDQEHSKFTWSLGVSLVALALSVSAIVAQLVTAK